MQPETYDYLCENALNRAIEDVLLSIPSSIQERYSLSYLNNFDKKKEKIFKEYNIQRKVIRKKFFDVGEDRKKLIDIHKVSAYVCVLFKLYACISVRNPYIIFVYAVRL